MYGLFLPPVGPLTVASLSLDVSGQLILWQGFTAARTLAKVVLLVTLRHQVFGQASDLDHLRQSQWETEELKWRLKRVVRI